LSKEEAVAKVEEAFSAEYVSKFEEAKWQDKVEGFKGISE
jgi:intein-encoded DNA endonuclease-like protein